MSNYSVVFSPTGGTKAVLDVLTESWNISETIDLSAQPGIVTYQFQKGDVCFVAVPSYGGRVPKIAAERLSCIKGNGARAVLVAVFGNRAYDDTLLELKHEMEARGFVCAAAVAANAEHSMMRQFGAGRPDDQDRRQLKQYAEEIRRKLELGSRGISELHVPGKEPYCSFNGLPMVPKAGKACNSCGICAEQCPAGAIDRKDPKNVSKDLCITCMRCVSVCPQNARGLNKAVLMAASVAMKKACGKRKENELFLN